MAQQSWSTDKVWDASQLRADIVTETSVTPDSVDYDEKSITIIGGFTAQQFTDIGNNIINA